MKTELDWSAWEGYGQGDAYAAVPRQGGGFGRAAALCIGSRQCQKARGQAGDKGVMCPSFRITGEDRHSTRGRAALLRELLDAPGETVRLDDPGLQEAMSLCVACKGCKRECPNGVDMAALRTEVLAQRWRRESPPWRTRLMASVPRWLPWLRWLRPLLAWRNRSAWLARRLERLGGVAAARSLPLPAARSFDRLEPRTTIGLPDDAPALREVVLLVDCFSNHLEPQVAQDALRVLQAAGVRVHRVRAPAGGPALCCGRPGRPVASIRRATRRAGCSRRWRRIWPPGAASSAWSPRA